MTDLIQVLPDLDTQSFSHILPSLEKASLTTNDLITLEAVDVAKRAQVPPNEVKRLANEVVHALHAQLGLLDEDEASGDSDADHGERGTVSTLDDDLDIALNGGFPTGHLVEITGERLVTRVEYKGLVGWQDIDVSFSVPLARRNFFCHFFSRCNYPPLTV